MWCRSSSLYFALHLSWLPLIPGWGLISIAHLVLLLVLYCYCHCYLPTFVVVVVELSVEVLVPFE